MGHTAPVRLRKPRGQGASRRGEILEAAKRIFTEEGFAQATMRRIASAVGVSPTAIYLHFADKDAILKAIAEDFFSELLHRLQETHALDQPSLQSLRDGMRAYVAFAMERADEYRLTFQHRTVRAAPRNEAEPDMADLSFAVLEDGVSELMEQGIFRQGDRDLVAEAIFCSLHGVTMAVINLADRMCTPPAALIEAVIDATITGFLAPGVRVPAAA